MECDKCSAGVMRKTKVFRFSGCLVAIGITLLVPSLLALLLATFIAITGTAATGAATVEVAERQKAETIESLSQIEGLPTAVLSDFEDDTIVSEATLSALTPEMRNEVEAVIAAHQLATVGAAAGTGMFAAVGTAVVVLIYVISIPALIVGFVLILRRKVWKCGGCGYIFDRA